MSGMNTADQVLAYLRVLVWPVIVAGALLLFRRPIGRLLDRIEGLEGFGIKAQMRSQVTKAAADSEAALAESPIRRVPNITPAVVVVLNMQGVLSLSPRLYPSIPGATGKQRMQWIVDRLETGIIAVLVAASLGVSTGVKDPADRPPWPEMTAADIERYMTAVTGVSGWRGVIEARNMLRVGLSSVCGKAGAELSGDAQEVVVFVTAGANAWNRLVHLRDEVVRLSPHDSAR
jgi:hypothetical protein